MTSAVHYYQPDQRFCACGVPWMYQKHTGDAEAVTCGSCIHALASGVSKVLRPQSDQTPWPDRPVPYHFIIDRNSKVRKV